MSRANLAFRVECETMHGRLCSRLRMVYLQRGQVLGFDNQPGAVEVGWYNQSVELVDFRRDCFWALEQLGRSR